MKSRTSFFNTTVLRKDITRYAPVWGLYTICMIVFLLTPNLFFSAQDKAEALIESMPGFGTINIILAGICALMVFGDLFKTRLCYATHAMPLRRECWFATHFTAGMLFSTIPNLFIALCFLPMMREHWYIALLWFIANLMQYLFFFGIGAFSAMCAGNRLGAAAVYLILNFTTYLIGWYSEEIFTPMLYGIEFDGSILNFLTPVNQMAGMELVSYIRMPFQVTGSVAVDWIYLAVMAVLGAVFTVLAILVYRKRDLETAGDFLSLPASKPVFLVIYTLTLGLLFHGLFLFVGLFVGLIVGLFTGKMLLERTVRVFKGKTFLFAGIFLTVMAMALILTKNDPAGITRYVPETDDVESMHFYDNSERSSYASDADALWVITEPAEIDEFRQFHQAMADRRYEDTEEIINRVYVHYNLKNGRTVVRRYEVPVYTPEGEFTRLKLSSWQAVFQSQDWNAVLEKVDKVELELPTGDQLGQAQLTDPAQIRGLLEAMKADCDAGNMAQSWNFHNDEDNTTAWVYIFDSTYYEQSDDLFLSDYAAANMHRVYSLSLNVYSSCVHTNTYLQSLGLEIDPYEK